MTDAQVKKWIKDNWKHAWWGLMDCDRCPHGRGNNGGPCDPCGMWPYLIRTHRSKAEKANTRADTATPAPADPLVEALRFIADCNSTNVFDLKQTARAALAALEGKG